MHVLALETSGRTGSIALLETVGGASTILAAHELPPGERTARTLLPAVHDALVGVGWKPSDVELIAVTTGPGSFTGLRLGVVAAKTLAYALGAKLVGVHTLAAMAAGYRCDGGRLWTVLDAQRKELFVASFDPRQPVADQADPATEILAIDEWLTRLAPGDAVAGPPVAKLREQLPAGVLVVEVDGPAPAAADVGRLAAVLAERGAVVDPLALVPQYYRQSAAEEKRSNKATGLSPSP
jgi:tRNA threonylcarbamoyladenosine biosynthesis protein TsaB